jgi:hypothetical protein
MRTPCTGLDRRRPSSTAVANSAESGARSFLICKVEHCSRRIAPNSSRTSAGSTSASLQPAKPGLRAPLSGADTQAASSPRTARRSPRVALDPLLEVVPESNSRDRPGIPRVPIALRLPRLSEGAKGLRRLAATMLPDHHVRAIAPAATPAPVYVASVDARRLSLRQLRHARAHPRPAMTSCPSCIARGSSSGPRTAPRPRRRARRRVGAACRSERARSRCGGDRLGIQAPPD